MKSILTLLILTSFVVCALTGCNGENEPTPPTLPQYGMETKSSMTTEQTMAP